MSEQTPGATVHDLIRQREQLTGWIARLDEVGGQASTRAAERIRADYVERLRRVNESLSSHRGEIQADLERFRGALAQAEERRLAVADEMDEVSLRHLIGELDEEAWNAARPDLEARVRAEEEAVAAARAEVERLETLAADIASAEHEVPSLGQAHAAEAEAAPQPAAAEPEPVAEAPASPFDRDATEDFEPELPADLPTVDDLPSAAPAQTSFEAPPADVREAADAVSADEWDPFGGEFGTEPKMGDAEEDLPWLEGIDEAARGWTPPAAAPADDQGLEFLRGIDEPGEGPAATPPSAPSGGDLGADDLAFLEE
ncbi:MAG TPA: hypothetical protein VHG93_19530, partial [Longimicrobium sp.]|nr:hypothetical protein [Longimicrobium sp.]